MRPDDERLLASLAAKLDLLAPQLQAFQTLGNDYSALYRDLQLLREEFRRLSEGVETRRDILDSKFSILESKIKLLEEQVSNSKTDTHDANKRISDIVTGILITVIAGIILYLILGRSDASIKSIGPAGRDLGAQEFKTDTKIQGVSGVR